MKFKLFSDYKPQGDQPEAIRQLTAGLGAGEVYQVLLGVTGSGKTFTMANVIEKVNRPTLIISHNKTLAAQLYGEFKQFFPENAVEYFVSYYDYYQPEAYIPQTDTYIEKDLAINDQIDRLRLKATSSLLERRDVIIVASVSCIYNIGSPDEFRQAQVVLTKGAEINRDEIIRQLISIYYERNDIDFHRGTVRVKGEIVDIFPANMETAIRLELDGNMISRIREVNPVSLETIAEKDKVYIYPAKHYVTSTPQFEKAMANIKIELEQTLAEMRSQNKLLEAQRLEQRTNFDLEMIREIGYCSGIENYSRHFDNRQPGERPKCLIDYFPEDYLMFIDESHVTIPQLNGMYHGDRSRKQTLIDYGFRLPSAIDNRPLKFAEIESLMKQVIFVSATPAKFELEKTKGVIVEQVIRPTGLVDPEIVIRPSKGQIDDLIKEVMERVAKHHRTLVTTLTKRMAEDLTDFLLDKGLRVKYLHSEIDTLERVEILRDLRKGEFDCLVGVNLLREGLDLPEVSLVAIMDADKEGFLRSETSLVQVCGRAARNVDGKVLMYADNMTGSMQRAISEIKRRRIKQMEYNKIHKITPRTIQKAIQDLAEFTSVAKQKIYSFVRDEGYKYTPEKATPALLKDLERQMREAADNLDFELAIMLRNRLLELSKAVKAKDSLSEEQLPVKTKSSKNKEER
ncbi:MAG: excinuclease ABC subunit UvrB [bacterium]|nr:excinuclease ABC subunit UvrB [bacterium]MDD5353622.1 excinuclease ABC subunit UvrB [bacterium]MDD5756502.1 excinuclease ABC subunit UvrB [bacterium]